MFDRRAVPHPELSDADKIKQLGRVAQKFKKFNTEMDKVRLNIPQDAQTLLDTVFGMNPHSVPSQTLFGKDTAKNFERVCSKWKAIDPPKYEYGRSRRAKRKFLVEHFFPFVKISPHIFDHRPES